DRNAGQGKHGVRQDVERPVAQSRGVDDRLVGAGPQERDVREDVEIAGQVAVLIDALHRQVINARGQRDHVRPAERICVANRAPQLAGQVAVVEPCDGEKRGLDGPDIDRSAKRTQNAALVGRWRAVVVAGVYCRAVCGGQHGGGRAAVVLQGPKLRIDRRLAGAAQLVAASGIESASHAGIAKQVVALRNESSLNVRIGAILVAGDEGVFQRDRAGIRLALRWGENPADVVRLIAGERVVEEHDRDALLRRGHDDRPAVNGRVSGNGAVHDAHAAPEVGDRAAVAAGDIAVEGARIDGEAGDDVAGRFAGNRAAVVGQAAFQFAVADNELPGVEDVAAIAAKGLAVFNGQAAELERRAGGHFEVAIVRRRSVDDRLARAGADDRKVDAVNVQVTKVLELIDAGGERNRLLSAQGVGVDDGLAQAAHAELVLRGIDVQNLVFGRPDIDLAADDAGPTALVGRPAADGRVVARVDQRTARQRDFGQSRAAIVLQRPELGIDDRVEDGFCRI